MNDLGSTISATAKAWAAHKVAMMKLRETIAQAEADAQRLYGVSLAEAMADPDKYPG